MTLKLDVTIRHVFEPVPGDVLGAILERLVRMAATLDDVVAKVTTQGTVIASAVTLLNELKTKLDAAIASGNMAKVQEIATALDTQRQQLADAVQANTPAEPSTP